MTPQGEIAPGLPLLLERMRELAAEMSQKVGYNCGFNAALTPADADVSCLELLDNAEEYSCVCEVPEDSPAYDIWARGKLVHVGFSLDQAADFLLKAYLGAKLHRVEARQRGQEIQCVCGHRESSHRRGFGPCLAPCACRRFKTEERE